MIEPKIALLADRGVVAVAGPDAEKLLQGLLTSDLCHLKVGQAQLAGLLTPQGKILFEMLVIREPSGAILLEVARQQAPGLAQRLQLYKLRANVTIRDVSADYTVAAAWGGPAVHGGALLCRDMRHDTLGHRLLCSMATDRALGDHDAKAASAPEYHAHRIALGIPEGGRDYDFNDAFPHDANFDLNGGVSFDKGCFVGQEVVSRMQHKSVVRKRVVRVEGAAVLPEGRADVTAGTAVIGRLGSVAGARGLALVRLDRVVEALDKGESILVAGISVNVDTAALDRYRASAAQRSATP